MKIRALEWVAMVFIVLIQTSCVSHDKDVSKNASALHHCPSKFVNSYSVPGTAEVYICCSPDSMPDQVNAIFANNEPVTSKQINSQPNSNMAVLNSTESSCVSKDSLTAIEVAKLSASSACNSFITHEQIECECQSQCVTPCFDISCNCPGVPAGELPVVSETQDSTGSQAIFLGKVTTSCGEPNPDIEG